MKQEYDTIVMKFGGASVASPEHFARIADIILTRTHSFRHVVVVVSAMGDTTNQLIELARKVNPDPPRREYDMLVTVGERISISLLAMALAAKNKEAVSFTGSQSGIITCGRHTDARITNVKPHRLLPVLQSGKIAIVAGFQGVSEAGEITTLGRGGSDTTAVALAAALNADRVEFFKDVAGIFSEDPKKSDQARLQEKLSYVEAKDIIERGAKVLHGRCIDIASRNSIPLHVRSFNEFDPQLRQGTLISDPKSCRLKHPLYETVP